jgi:hypothetical protein
MACDRFAGAIAAHALGTPLAAEAGAHLAGCSRCRAALETERLVLATIDAALEDVSAAAPSPNFLSRIRAHVEAAPPRWALPEWRLPAAAAAVVLLILAAALSRAPGTGSPQHEAVAAGHLADVPLQRQAAHVTDQATAQPLPARQKPPQRPARAKAGPSRDAQTPEILVPGQEREAVGRLFASLRAGRPEVVSILLTLRGGETASDASAVTIAPLRIDPVVVAAMPASAFISEK